MKMKILDRKYLFTCEAKCPLKGTLSANDRKEKISYIFFSKAGLRLTKFLCFIRSFLSLLNFFSK